MRCKKSARVAQLVEQRTENPRVGGSNPPPSTISLGGGGHLRSTRPHVRFRNLRLFHCWGGMTTTDGAQKVSAAEVPPVSNVLNQVSTSQNLQPLLAGRKGVFAHGRRILDNLLGRRHPLLCESGNSLQ